MHLIGELWLLFHAAFDGTAEATRANGSPTPCRAEGLSFAEGRIGQAVRLNRAARRGDLKLWINYMIPANGKHPDFMKPDFMARAWRGAGLDAARLSREAPNVILGQTMVPADYRWAQPSSYASAEAREHQRTIDETPGFYANLRGAAFPLVHQHDRY